MDGTIQMTNGTLEIVSRDEFALYINKHKELDAKPFEAKSICSMMFISIEGITMAQAIYYKSRKPIYKIRK